MRLTGRKSEIMALDALMCLFVVFIHATSAAITELDRQGVSFALAFFPWRLLAINVPGFLFLGGVRMFLNRPGPRDYKRFYLTRVTRVILPYILFTVIYYLYFVKIGYFPFSVPDLLHYIADGSITAPFYFVIIIAQLYALAPVWDLLVRRVSALPMLLFAALLTFLCRTYLTDIIALISPGARFIYSDRVFTSYLFFWLAGCYAGLHYDAFKALLAKHRVFIVAVFAFCTALEAVFSYWSFSRGIPMPFLETVHYMYCIAAVFFLYTLALLVYEKRELKNRLALAVSGASYHIYLLHCLVIVEINRQLAAHGFGGPAKRYLVRLPATFVITLALCLLYGLVKRHVKARIRQRAHAEREEALRRES